MSWQVARFQPAVCRIQTTQAEIQFAFVAVAYYGQTRKKRIVVVLCSYMKYVCISWQLPNRSVGRRSWIGLRRPHTARYILKQTRYQDEEFHHVEMSRSFFSKLTFVKTIKLIKKDTDQEQQIKMSNRLLDLKERHHTSKWVSYSSPNARNEFRVFGRHRLPSCVAC